MRKIKFRAISVETGEWVYGYYTLLNCKANILAISTNPPDGDPMWGKHFIGYDVIPESVCQYTGLKDKNCKEIYEYDIVKDCNGDVFEVKWQQFGGAWILSGKKHHFLFAMRCLDYFEVIGNTCENMELLEAE